VVCGAHLNYAHRMRHMVLAKGSLSIALELVTASGIVSQANLTARTVNQVALCQVELGTKNICGGLFRFLSNIAQSLAWILILEKRVHV